MTIEECYAALEGDYADVEKRLLGESRVRKFAIRFMDDDNFDNLLAAMNSRNYKKAFDYAHTLKGVSQTLAFTKLSLVAVQITEALRNNNITLAEALLPVLSNDYKQTVRAISQLNNF